MAYQKTQWKDHIEGVQVGTPVNAVNMNKIEEGIAASFAHVRCGEVLVPNGTLENNIYTGEVTVSFSPAFSRAPRVNVTPRTSNPYNVTASIGGPPTANSVKIIVKRSGATPDGYTAVQWIAVEP